ncbi:hypothetical protein [Paenibacillus camerounensis]|nr:hypothetical protein [Paenibacillus camerounensis]
MSVSWWLGGWRVGDECEPVMWWMKSKGRVWTGGVSDWRVKDECGLA